MPIREDRPFDPFTASAAEIERLVKDAIATKGSLVAYTVDDVGVKPLVEFARYAPRLVERLAAELYRMEHVIEVLKAARQSEGGYGFITYILDYLEA